MKWCVVFVPALLVQTCVLARSAVRTRTKVHKVAKHVNPDDIDHNMNGVGVKTWDTCWYKKERMEIDWPHWPGGRMPHEYACNDNDDSGYMVAVHLEKGCDWDPRSRIECQRLAESPNKVHCDSFIFTGCATVHMLCCTSHAKHPPLPLSEKLDNVTAIN